MRRCALFLLIALAVALLAVGAQAQERSDATGDPPAAPRISRLNWSGLTIRVGWNPVARATGYDLRWTPAEQRRRHLTVSAVDGSPAEFSAPWAGRWRVEVRARIGSGPSAVRGAWSRPRILRVYDAPPRLGVERFDGEYARLNWTGVGANYEIEWGERGGAKRFVRRDGRSPTLKLGPLKGGKTYEFRVRARDEAGHSDYSPTAVFTPTAWRGFRPGAAYVGRIGQIYALWLPQRGAEWYELSWINAADPTETARVRVGAATTGGSRAQVPGQIGREGGFENGTWNVRVRAGPRGAWSPTYPLTLSNQPERLTLELESSRELCTAGTLTEIMWKISGGSAPYALSVDNSTVDVSADNVRINCGALSAAEAADEEAALAAKRVTAVVTDARGVRREAALDVARARALPAPTGLSYGSHFETVLVGWSEADPNLSADAVARYRPIGGAEWSYSAADYSVLTLETPPGEHMASVAAVRHVLEVETPDALNWSEELRFARTVAPQNLVATATHDTVTVAWDKQPYTNQMPSVRLRTTSNRDGSLSERVYEEDGEYGRHEVVFKHVPPDTEYVVTIVMSDFGTPVGTSTMVRTLAAPAGWTPPARGPQNLRATATRDNITVTWEHPHDSVRASYIVELIDDHSGTLLNHTWVSTQTSWTGRARNGAALRPGKQYRIRVKLMTFTLPTVEVVVKVPAAQASASSAQDEGTEQESPRLPFFPRWPVSIDGRYAMTDDPFEWRARGYHAGLDIGERGGENGISTGNSGDVSGDPVYAVEAGVLRLFGNERGSTVLYCRDERLLLHERFHASEFGWGSAWWDRDKKEMHIDRRRADSDNNVFCDDVMSYAGGRGALIAHTLPDGRGVVTKYGHLASATREILEALGVHSDCFGSDGEINSPNDDKCNVNSSLSVHVSRGQRIGTIGASFYGGKLNEFFDEHVHFEIRTFDVPLDDGEEWYTKADRCGNQVTSDADCTWNGRTRRYMKSVEDAEAYLPPLPASTTPTDRGWLWYRHQPIAEANPDRHVVEIASASESDGALSVKTSISFWRPLFYTDFEGQQPRTELYGIAGTGPGVIGYRTNVTCANPMSKNASNVITDGSELPTTDGEIRRTVRAGTLAISESCVVAIYSINTTYPGVTYDPIRDAEFVPRTIPRDDITLRDPAVTLTWVAELSAGTNAVRTGERLDGDALDLYTFTARRDYTYRFCTYPSSQSTNECADESDDSEENSNVAQLLIIGADGSITDGVVKNTSGLAWTVPDNAPLEGDYVLVVRRRARVEGSVDDYSYKLKYTVPAIKNCASLGGELLFLVCIPVEPTPSVSSRTHNTVTVSWSEPDGAMSYETNRLPADASCDTEGVKATFTPDSANAAGGVRGAGNTSVSFPFGNLAASTPYMLCVRSVRTIEPGFVLESDWVSVSTTTKAEPLPKPSGTSVTNIGETSLTLNWGEVADAGGYKVKRTGSSSTWTLLSTRRSFTFTGLTSDFRYTLSVQALPKAGSSKVASAWAREPGRTDSVPTTPTPSPQPDPPPPIDCLSTTKKGWATYRGSCDPVPAAQLLDAVHEVNSAVCGILRWERKDSEGNDIWVRYGLAPDGRTVPGSVNFQIKVGNTIFLGGCSPTSGGASGASGLETPSCPDAVKPETGPAVIDADASSCTTVRGGGALQISRGEYTLNVSLASDRDWFAFAPDSYTGSSAGAFLFLDLSTGGWIALYPPDGVELERHTPADATALPALLDAIAASAAPPATE